MRRRLPARAWIAGIAVLGAAGLAVTATRGLGEAAVFYRTPTEVARGTAAADVVRVGGTVAPGTIRWDEQRGVLHFVLTDGRTRLRVANRGAPPRLFRAGEEALVEGRVSGGVLRAADVIVKHDEEYRPQTTPEASP
jgi:cytochrome c-type biogenesis protein CcmE